MVFQGWRFLSQFLWQFCYHPRGKIDSLLFLENDITWQAPQIIALLVVFSFWFWRLLEKRVIQKTLRRCLDEIWTHRFSFILICGLVSRMKALDWTVDRSCSVFPPVKFKVRHVQLFWTEENPLIVWQRERDCVPKCSGIPKSAGWFWFWNSSTEQLDSVLFKILKSRLLSSRTFSIAAGPFLQSWRP